MASTLLNEQGWHPDVIELQLAHAERNKVRAAYNRAQRMIERRQMMQAWADYLDNLAVDAEDEAASRSKAAVSHRISLIAMSHAAFAKSLPARPPRLKVSRPSLVRLRNDAREPSAISTIGPVSVLEPATGGSIAGQIDQEIPYVVGVGPEHHESN
jgi:hypothetical protein